MATINGLQIDSVVRKARKLTINFEIGRLELDCDDVYDILGAPMPPIPRVTILEGSEFWDWMSLNLSKDEIDQLAIKPLLAMGFPEAAIVIDSSYIAPKEV